MSNAAADRDDLDQELAAEGSDAELVRVVGTTNQVRFTAAVRAYARDYFPRELGGEIIQGDTKVIISPTDIERAQWPGAQAIGGTGDNRVPRKGDKIIVQGRERTILVAMPFYIDGELVRIELQARGQNP